MSDPQESDSDETAPLQINGVTIEPTFAEAFDMKATRVIVTAIDAYWARQAAVAMSGFGTSVIDCKIEIDIERELTADETPDGRPGFALLGFAMSGDGLDKQIVRRCGQCVLTCPTTSLFSGMEHLRDQTDKRVALGKALRFFGDGHQISKWIEGQRYWRVPVMDGEFLCQHDAPRTDGIGGGNFLLVADSIGVALQAAKTAVDAIAPLPRVIAPFPGGVVRSGSKVGSKYKTLVASTNDAYCPTLRGIVDSKLTSDQNAVLEIVLDGLDFDSIATAIGTGVHAACEAFGQKGLLAITAGNYGGKLGRHHFKLHEILR
ncbi:formylmethanofuran--tetrahydromethanopterin N-formyltransferase [Rhodopirellula sp. MGV]|uniref:formylmethanofuran--tetrahydromethanopterin N-formyltransferase n=1 Tax=Rhodopirellula sp. MGV TaxID=2023130 RepID=UPI000B96C0A1|nr:formylmethanofuran--tetrahydromethanopterin N-formyltransferase [Rhodopirellula sp. MGV]OYP28390.1 formylmethanofuran--tetrahydromethanopterin N-formyltransferase [Rhodopirellula sp. MGV]PNY38736.1 formylmethanofuran--tetrahydromethanopterin N-formyltransferase [Rhodopirellula baltica]